MFVGWDEGEEGDCGGVVMGGGLWWLGYGWGGG